jgi:hypothetical protein
LQRSRASWGLRTRGRVWICHRSRRIALAGWWVGWQQMQIAR